MEHLYSFITICIVLVISPGPNTFLIFNTAASIGKIDAITKILGLITATYIHGLLSLFGISLIILKSFLLFNIVKLIGASYLLYLGIRFIRSIFITNNEIIRPSILKKTIYKNFQEGFLTQILNPKVSMFYLAAFPQFINFKNKDYIDDGLILISVHAITIVIWFVFMTFFIGIFLRKKGDLKLMKSITLMSGLFLMYFSFLLVMQPLPH
ncbi:LysE family translocator [Acinetobacter sp.]|uniref:LysE family translocator n=1 Tax=Acinetobacter sp. TaxID=472 RepID=UPI0031D8FC3E